MTDTMHNTRGFSLVEILIAVILVGLAIAALVAANTSFTMANDAGSEMSTAEFLVEQIRELTMLLPILDADAGAWIVLGPETGETDVSLYDDVDDFDSATFAPPINSDRAPLTDLARYSQRVTVEKLNPSNFNDVWDDATNSPFVRITVRVFLDGREISSATWIRALY